LETVKTLVSPKSISNDRISKLENAFLALDDRKSLFLILIYLYMLRKPWDDQKLSLLSNP